MKIAFHDSPQFGVETHLHAPTGRQRLIKQAQLPLWLVDIRTGIARFTGIESQCGGLDSEVIPGQTLYISGDDNIRRNELWSYSPEVGVVLVADIYLAGNSHLSGLTVILYVGDEPENPDYNDSWKRTFSSSFTVQSPQTGNKPLTITTEELFVSTVQTDTNASGILQVRAAHGSEIRVVADNGDPSTFQADITSDGAVTSFMIPWEGDLRLRCLIDPQSPNSLSDYCR